MRSVVGRLRMSSKGFTLIELLVVIAIIAILAAILFPVFARAREKARSVTCQTNLKQLAIGMIAYVQDYDERFPNWNWGRDRGNPPVHGQGPGTPLPWYAAIYPYVKNKDLYVCPSDTRCPEGGPLGRMCCTDCKYDRWPLSYTYNEPISANCCNFNLLANIKLPAQTLLLADGRSSLTGWDPGGFLARIVFANFNARGDAFGGCCNPNTVNTEKMTDDKGPRHLGGCNIAFADGHVKWFKWNLLRVPPDGPIILRKSHESRVMW